MKPVDNRDKSGSGNLDDILAELKTKKSAAPKANDRMVDNLLAEMGLKEDAVLPRTKIPARTTPAPQKPAQPAAPARQPEEQPRQAPQKPAAPPSQTPANAEAAPRQDTPPKTGNPPKAQASPQTKPARRPAPKAEAGARPEPAQTTTFTPPAKQASGSAQPAAPATAPGATRLLADATAAQPAQPPRPSRPGDTTAVWSNGEPRLGKAAAMEKVDHDKFTSDSELMSWYSADAEIYTSKREMKRAEKERKRQEAADRKLAKKSQYAEPDEDIYVPVAQPEDVEVPEEAAPDWPAPSEEEVVTGSAFDEPTGEDNWGEETAAEFFDPARAQAEAQAQAAVAPTAAAHPTQTDTRNYHLSDAVAQDNKVPTAAYTQEFDENGQPLPRKDDAGKNLFVDQMVDDRFREFFSETVIMDREQLEEELKGRSKRKAKKSRTALLTGELSKMVEAVDETEDEDFDDYNRPQDAPQIENEIAALRSTMTRRTILTGALALLLVWLGLGFSGILPVPELINPIRSPVVFAAVYGVLMLGVVVVNFTTVASGLIGLVGQPTIDSAPGLAGVAGLLQAVVLIMQSAIQSEGGSLPRATLFGGLIALGLAFNTLGKRIRVRSILDNFQLASAGFDHSAAYVLDNTHEAAYNLTRGLGEENPALLVSRPTALVKGFMRQSFSPRKSDQNGRILGWILLGVGLVAGVVTYFSTKELLQGLSALAAVFSVGAPFSSALVSAIPSALLQQGTSKVGAVVPGWSAIEELGDVNVVMAGARDIFPPSSVTLKGIKTFQKERVDLAILYAASVLIEGCDTLRDIFLGVIQGKSDMLYKVESLMAEPGRGFTAWVENSRVVIGSREMLQKHDIDPPPMEVELKYTADTLAPVYLAVSGKLVAMFIIGYGADPEVKDTLDGLVRSGVSLMVKSEDMNVTAPLIEAAFGLPQGVIKVLGKRELEMMEPLQAYLPESDGVMTHLGTFTSFIGGMRAAAGCAASERMSGIVQLASVVLAAVLCLLLVINTSLHTLNMTIILLYQLGWTVLVSALPFVRRY